MRRCKIKVLAISKSHPQFVCYSVNSIETACRDTKFVETNRTLVNKHCIPLLWKDIRVRERTRLGAQAIYASGERERMVARFLGYRLVPVSAHLRITCDIIMQANDLRAEDWYRY